MRKSHIIILVVALAVLGGFFYFMKDKKVEIDNDSTPVVQTPIKTIESVIAPMQTQNASSTYAEMMLKYPKSDSKNLKEIYNLVTKEKNDFWKQYGTLTAEQAKEMYIRADNQYQLFIDTTVATSSKTVTYIVQIYQFLGGAHGGTSVQTFTYDISGKLVTIDKVFENNYLDVVSIMSKQYFLDKMGDYYLPEAVESGTLPNTENYSSWYLTDKQVTFIFGQYQVGPYVLGIQEFPIDKSKIQEILKPEFK